MNDTSCRFINKVLKKETGFGTKAEYLIKQIYIENYLEVLQYNDLHQQQIKLAALNANRQVIELLNHKVLPRPCKELNISVHGLVTSKETNRIIEI